jgi:hypothetical protein
LDKLHLASAFDPVGLTNSLYQFEVLKVKYINNGILTMFTMLGKHDYVVVKLFNIETTNQIKNVGFLFD